MKSLVLRLEGPLQAWATQSKLGIRDTDREPSKSGVLGLLGAALGMARDEDARLAELRALSMAVRVDRPGSLLRDYHTAGAGTFRGRGDYFVYGLKACVPTERYYLQDASFTVGLGGDEALVDALSHAVRRPRWPLFLGRRSCAPSAPILLGVANLDARGAVRAAALAERADPRLRLVVEATPEQGGEPRYDEPLSFREGHRRHGIRYVKTEWMEARDAHEAEEVTA